MITFWSDHHSTVRSRFHDRSLPYVQSTHAASFLGTPIMLASERVSSGCPLVGLVTWRLGDWPRCFRNPMFKAPLHHKLTKTWNACVSEMVGLPRLASSWFPLAGQGRSLVTSCHPSPFQPAQTHGWEGRIGKGPYVDRQLQTPTVTVCTS